MMESFNICHLAYIKATVEVATFGFFTYIASADFHVCWLIK